MAVRRISDRLCVKNGLSIIEAWPYRDQQKRTTYPKKTTHRDAIITAIDAALQQKPEDFEALLKLCYVLFPNGLNLREEVPNRNIFCVLVNLVRRVDAAVNVCPSIHVSSSVSIALVTAKSNLFKEHKWRKAAIILLMSLISISTLFVKQHSVIDVVCGAAASIKIRASRYKIC